MKNGYKEERILSMENLRKLCIKRNYYTKGDNEDYYQMLRKSRKANLTTQDIAEIAQDIMEHSEKEALNGSEITDVMFEIAEICKTIFEKE